MMDLFEVAKQSSDRLTRIFRGMSMGGGLSTVELTQGHHMWTLRLQGRIISLGPLGNVCRQPARAACQPQSCSLACEFRPWALQSRGKRRATRFRARRRDQLLFAVSLRPNDAADVAAKRGE
jgi:hypothetical protein